MERRKRKKPEQDAIEHILSGKDKAFIEQRNINAFKGRGVFAVEHIEASTFVVEYRGFLCRSKDVNDTQGKYLFDFKWNGTSYCMDASKEDGTLGRLVNDEHRNPNCRVKTIVVEGKPHLCLFSVRQILPNEEITYNYGDSPWPWRSMMPCDENSKPDTKQPDSALAENQTDLCDETLVVVPECSAASSSSDKDKMPCDENSKPDTKQPDSALAENQTMPCDENSKPDTKQPDSALDENQTDLCDETLVVVPECSAASSSSDKDKMPCDENSKPDTKQPDSALAENQTMPCDENSKPDTKQPDSALDENQTDLCDETLVVVPECSAASSSSDKDKMPCDENSKPDTKQPDSALDENQTDLCDETLVVVPECSAASSSSDKDKCRHVVYSAVISSLDSCGDCRGPLASIKWLGLKCKLCSRSWHKSCFIKRQELLLDERNDSEESEPHIEESSDEQYMPDSTQSSDDGSDYSLNISPHKSPRKITPVVSGTSKKTKNSLSQSTYCSFNEQDMLSDKTSSGQPLLCDSAPFENDTTKNKNEMLHSSQKIQTEISDERGTSEIVPKPKDASSTQKNYCYVCKKPQSKISRHLKNHEGTEPDIAAAFLLPKHSQERKRLLEKLRNKGNYQHNQEVMDNRSGPLKLKRRPRKFDIEISTKAYVHCAYCKGMFIRKELWRHTKRCPSKTASDSEATGKAKVLVMADIAETTFSQTLSPGLWKILANMKEDDISSSVRNDFLILQMGQCLYNKHGSDPTKAEYIRQKLREVGRLLLTLRRKFSIYNLEEALKPNLFFKVIEAVKDVAGYDEESHTYKTPSLALKLGHSLHKIGDIILSRAIAAEDDGMIKAAERFKRLCSSEWTQLVSHSALSTLSKSKFNKPSTIPFTKDVQLLNKCLEKKLHDAFESLKISESSQIYADLAKVTLTQIIVFNRRRAGEVSKMTLECFKKRDQTELHPDIAVGLSPFEQKMSKLYSRVEIMGKRGRKVAVLLNCEHLNSLTLLVDKRDACGVDKDNPFLFARPKCGPTSYYRGQDCIRVFASQCGAQNPEYLRSTHLRKHVATLSQILNLKDNELDQLANFLGHDIRVHRSYYRLPEATIEIAKISKLLMAMEKGTLARFQGKGLDDIDFEAELDLELDNISEDEESDSAVEQREQQTTSKTTMPHDKTVRSTGQKTIPHDETVSIREQRTAPLDETVSSTGKTTMPPDTTEKERNPIMMLRALQEKEKSSRMMQRALERPPEGELSRDHGAQQKSVPS
ncbi:uncharacterized protein [Channa argus]|uniref:uncharacterized protein isoform X9 n=2 Tax=Channa argus TaxID=215402 RepID=UPI003520E5F9